MTSCKIAKLYFPVIVLVALLHSANGWAAMQSSGQIIESNALLRVIFQKDPEKAKRLASEARQLLAKAERGDAVARDPRLEFRGGLQQTPAQRAQENGEILIRNRKDYDENPILREIYQHSPLASLRMLKRLREATEKNN